jgi:hypothetical protein
MLIAIPQKRNHRQNAQINAGSRRLFPLLRHGERTDWLGDQPEKMIADAEFVINFASVISENMRLWGNSWRTC